MNLSIKALQPHPIEHLRTTVGVRGRVQGVVTRVKDRVVDVSIDGGAPGIIPISEVDWQPVEHPRDILSPEQRIISEIIGFNDEQKLVLLSLKRTKPHPYDQLRQRAKAGDFVQARVAKIDGAFVNIIIDGGAQGSIHISELDWKRVENASEVVRENEPVTLTILEFRDDRRTVKLFLKRTRRNPKEVFFETARPGQIVHGTVASITHFGAFLDLGDQIQALVHKSKIAHHYVDNVADELHVNQQLRAVIVSVDRQAKKIGLSIKDCP